MGLLKRLLVFLLHGTVLLITLSERLLQLFFLLADLQRFLPNPGHFILHAI